MKHPLQLSFLSLCAGLLTGTTFLTPLAVDAQRGDGAELASAAAWPAALALPEFPICHMPAAAETARSVLRLAQTRTEVPPAEIKAATPAPAFADSEPPLWEGLGPLTYKIATANAEAQAYFDQGLRLAYAFNHDEAQRAFRKAQKVDPNCAMCFWGEALVLGPNINLPMQDDAIAPALAAAEQARALSANASPREQALIAALATRYAADPKAERAKLDAAYAGAMADVAAKFPDDNDIAALYAEAVMDLSPWNYWQPGGAEPNPQSAPILPTLERVLAKDPNHAGAIHLYIHAVEASDRPQRAEPYADRLRGAMPGAGHLVHMPSHIYYRVGRYLDALADNKTAAAVDEKYLAETNAPMGVYRLGYYPHNVHFVLAAAQMAGDGPTVIAAAEKLRGLIPQDIARGIAIAHPVTAAPYFAHAQFSPLESILALPDPGDAIAYAKGIWRYARGIAYVAQRNFDAAAAEANAIAALAREADFSLLKASGVPGQEVMNLAQSVIQGRIAQAQGNFTAAIDHFQQAAAIQDRLPYMEPPYWYYPVRQTLAAVLLQTGRLQDAEDQFMRALKRAPANGWSYYGLSQVYKARGDASAAGQAEAELAKTWIGDRAILQLGNL
ncbi:MAG TPA: tetratricopeptide repeat protein [Xanthobacteraceae bacterium]|jgi:tetratricopeptide (TPR) repeat protein|nr:tetratricopeptide repeat protein [Xanthobacteraceae bacterium]